MGVSEFLSMYNFVKKTQNLIQTCFYNLPNYMPDDHDTWTILLISNNFAVIYITVVCTALFSFIENNLFFFFQMHILYTS